MAMQGINQSVKLGLEILTPTQTGSGAELFKELDYIDRGGDVFVVDQVQSINLIAAGDAQLDTLLASAKLSDLVQAAGQDFGYKLPWQSSKQKLPDKLREQLKDAMNRPYVPGSALKGAIRTALVAEWLRSAMKNDIIAKHIKSLLPTKPNPKLAAKNLMDTLTGKDAKQDIFRAFKVKDALFNSTDLSLADIRWLNEKRWRSMSQKKSIENWQSADGLFAETLRPQALAMLTLQWDEFLLSDTRWHQKDTIASILPKNFEELKAKLNQHAQYRLDREIQFYHDQGKAAPENECKRLKALIANEPDAAYLQLSWGSGWRGMTGDWASEEQVKHFRELFNLGKRGNPLYPKTRRLAVSGEPKIPLGWVRLVPYDLVKDRLDKQQTQAQSQACQSPWVNQTLAKIAAQNRSTEKEALRGKALAEAWQAIEDKEEKQLAFEDIKKRWQAESWWDEPNGKSARQAKAIYEIQGG